MPRKPAPTGYLAPGEAIAWLKKQGMITSDAMLYRYVQQGRLHRYTPPERKHGYYKLEELERMIELDQAFYAAPDPTDTSSNSGPHTLTFAQATPDDMPGVYAVASRLFDHTTSADGRKPLVELCPIGNYVVKDAGRVVAFIHIQPLKHDRLDAFMRGEIRGWQLTADDLTGFEPGQEVSCLIKSMGAYHPEKSIRLMYMQRLLSGTRDAMGELGSQGVHIVRLYATSETEDGILFSAHAKMQSLGTIPGSAGKKRFAFVLDIATSDLPLLQPYKRAYAEYLKSQHTPTKKRALAAPAMHTGVSDEKSTMPDTLVGWREFARLHEIAETTIHKAIESGRLPLVEGSWTVGRAPVKGAFDAAGRARFYELYSGKPQFVRCDDCPHA